MSSGTVVGERTLWSGTQPRICSASRRPTAIVSIWMREAVDEVHRQWLALPVEWTPQQRNLYLDLVTERLDSKAFELEMELKAGAIREWIDQHGQHPDYDTTVRLHQTAQQNAREAIVRQELYNTIPVSPDETEYRQPSPVTGVPWESRWKDPRYRPEPTEQIEDLARAVWPAPRHTAMFRVVASHLLATRHEEGLELPTSPRHVLAARLIPQINEELAAIGYPAE